MNLNNNWSLLNQVHIKLFNCVKPIWLADGSGNRLQNDNEGHPLNWLTRAINWRWADLGRRHRAYQIANERTEMNKRRRFDAHEISSNSSSSSSSSSASSTIVGRWYLSGEQQIVRPKRMATQNDKQSLLTRCPFDGGVDKVRQWRRPSTSYEPSTRWWP